MCEIWYMLKVGGQKYTCKNVASQQIVNKVATKCFKSFTVCNHIEQKKVMSSTPFNRDELTFIQQNLGKEPELKTYIFLKAVAPLVLSDSY